MVLIVGGEGSGKREFAKDLGYSRMADGVLDDCPVIFHTEKLVWDYMENLDELKELLLQKELVICNEVGSGVIPMEHSERLWRENTGRLCCRLAKEATAVVRLVCGIPTVIKGEL